MAQQGFTRNYDSSKELCFDGNEFAKDSFSIEEFLRQHRSASLEVMRDDLGTYLKTLRLSMIELINKDYEDFVNLSKDLVGLNNGIQSIQVPLEQLKEEVLHVKNSLHETISGLHHCLEQQREIRETKRSLHHMTQIISSIEKLKSILRYNVLRNSEPLTLDLIERAAMEFNQLQFSMLNCRTPISGSFKRDSEDLHKSLLDILNNKFFECVSEKQVNELSRCLQVFASLGRIESVQNLVRTDIVAPALDSIISKSSLEKKSNNLQAVYNEVLEFVDSHMKELLLLTTHTDKEPTVKGFDFITNSLWPELEQGLELRLALIFTQNELFHTRYIHTVGMLDALELLCGNQGNVLKLRSHSHYQGFLKKWNLPVYFKIRFQEIAAQMEVILAEMNPSTSMNTASDGFALMGSSFALKCLERCWCKEVYIPELGDMFWKLSLQILARYTTWISDTLRHLVSDQNAAVFTEPFIIMGLFQEATPEAPAKGDASVGSLPNGPGGKDQAKQKLDFLVCLYSDTVKVAREAFKYLEGCKEQIPNESTARMQLDGSLAESITLVGRSCELVSGSIVTVLVKKSVGFLGQVSDVPRRYRQIKRDSPTTASNYVALTLALPSEFHAGLQGKVEGEALTCWLTAALTAITEEFHRSVNTVIMSAESVENSLRKRKKTLNWSNDDRKIREQLVVDVLCFRNGVCSLDVDPGQVTMLQDLVTLVESARDKTEKQ